MSNSAEPIKLYFPIEYTWKITEEKLREMYEALLDQEEEDLDDDANSTTGNEFTETNSDIKEIPSMPAIKYFLKFESNTRPVNRFFSLFLYVPFVEGIKVHGKYSFFIKSANFTSQFDYIFTRIADNWGDDICPIDQVLDSVDTKRKFIVDGMLTLQMRGILIVEQEAMPIMLSESNILSEGLWKRNDRDFEIAVGDGSNNNEGRGKVMVHKIVLATRSPVFEAMFEAGMEEAQTNILKIPDFTLKTVQTAIEFFYCQDIFQSSMTFNDAFELFRFADKYHVNDLQLKLDTYFSYHLSPSTVCQLVNGSINVNYSKLHDICVNFLMICLRHTIPVESFDTLDQDTAAELLRKAFAPASD